MSEKPPSYIATHGKLTPPEKNGGAGLLERLWLRWYGVKGVWKARVDDPHEKPLTDMAETLSKKFGFKKTPTVYIYKDENPELIKIPGHALVISTALLDILTPKEVESIIARQLVRQGHYLRDKMVLGGIGLGELGFEAVAHEPIHHIVEKHITKDLKKQILLTVGEVLASSAVAATIERVYDRGCEYEADRDGAKATGQPKQMISALEKAEEGVHDYEIKQRAKMSSWRRWLSETADQHEPQWVRRVRKTGNPMEILNSEPSMSSRVKALKSLEAEMDTGKSVVTSR